MSNQKETISILQGGAKSLSDIASYYGVSTKTMSKRIRIAGIDLHKNDRKRLYYPREIRQIVEEFGQI